MSLRAILLHKLPSPNSDWTARQPTLVGGSGDDAAGINWCLARAPPLRRLRTSGVSMSEYVWGTFRAPMGYRAESLQILFGEAGP